MSDAVKTVTSAFNPKPVAPTIIKTTAPAPTASKMPVERKSRETSRRAQMRSRRRGRRSTILTDSQNRVGSSGGRLGS